MFKSTLDLSYWFFAVYSISVESINVWKEGGQEKEDIKDNRGI